MTRISKGFRIKKSYNTSFSPKTPSIANSPATPKSQIKEFNKSSKAAFIKNVASQSPSFPGVIKDSKDYTNSTPGLFVQSIKGMKGKGYIEKGINRGFQLYLSSREE